MGYSSFRQLAKDLDKQIYSCCYWLIHPDSQSRRDLLKQLTHLLISHLPSSELCTYSKNSSTSLSSWFSNEVQSCSLFFKSKLIVIEDVDRVASDELHLIKSILADLPSQVFVCLSAKDSKITEQGSTIDLGRESPQSKRAWLYDFFSKRASSAGKFLGKKAFETIVAHVGLDFFHLQNELDKIIDYSEKEELTESDIGAVVTCHSDFNIWQLADKLVWQRIPLPSLDATSVLKIIAPVRYQLTLGLHLATGVENSPLLRKVTIGRLAHYRKRLHEFNTSYFATALTDLFHSELLMKNSSLPVELLIHCFTARLLRKTPQASISYQR